TPFEALTRKIDTLASALPTASSRPLGLKLIELTSAVAPVENGEPLTSLASTLRATDCQAIPSTKPFVDEVSFDSLKATSRLGCKRRPSRVVTSSAVWLPRGV